MTKESGSSAANVASPFSRPLSVSEVPSGGLDLVLTANPVECAALAAANGILAVARFEARLHVDRTHGDGLEVSGAVEAQVRQSCVVTLEEFDTTVTEPVEIRFAPQKPPAPPAHEKKYKDAPRSRRRSHERVEEEAAILSLDPEGEDPPDPLIGGMVDLGAIAAEFFALALDPYPRKPGAHFSLPEQPGADVSAFSGLRSISGGAASEDEER